MADVAEPLRDTIVSSQWSDLSIRVRRGAVLEISIICGTEIVQSIKARECGQNIGAGQT